MGLRLFALLLGLLALATASPAQTPGAGPALWRVADSDSSVFIVGVPGGLPKALKWRTTALEAHLQGADTLLLPPQAKGGPVAAIKFLLKARTSFQSPRPLEETLSPALRARFVAAVRTVGKKPDRYGKWKPGVAGMMLVGDFRGAEQVAFGEPERRIRAMAKAANLRERRVASYDLGALINALTTLSDETHRICLADSLTLIEAGRGRLQAASQGWARGDVRAAMAAEGDYDRCLALIPALTAYNERGMSDTTGAIAAALARPGKTVAVVDLRQLMIRGGVLDRLRARGLKVELARD
jgi:uncharacterized protein YbaP (TraB family)